MSFQHGRRGGGVKWTLDFPKLSHAYHLSRVMSKTYTNAKVVMKIKPILTCAQAKMSCLHVCFQLAAKKSELIPINHTVLKNDNTMLLFFFNQIKSGSKKKKKQQKNRFSPSLNSSRLIMPHRSL